MKYAVTLLFGIALLSAYGISYTQEYLYPVASVLHNNEKHFYLIHQTSVDQLDLLLWNPQTKETQKVLLSHFTPAGLQIIRGGAGFSFIDHDTLRIKMHYKRSPKLIDFEEPLYDITLISWINATTCYFSACYNTAFGIYQASLQGHCDCIVASDSYDCLYPQKINDHLFYIERDKEGSHKIVSIAYPDVSYYASDPVRYLDLQKKTETIRREYQSVIKHTVLDIGKKSIAFLQMINEFEGFFIEHPSEIEKNDVTIPFVYHYLYRTDNAQWNDIALFQFSLPAYYLIQKDNNRLYESILPLLPRYVAQHVLFVDCDASTDSVSIKAYSMKDAHITSCISAHEQQSYFGMVIDNEIVYYGGNVLHDDTLLPRMWLNNGMLCVDLPALPIMFERSEL